MDSPPLSRSPAPPLSSLPPTESADIPQLTTYLSSLLSLLLPGPFPALFTTPSYPELASRLFNDPSLQALYITKYRTVSEPEGEGEEGGAVAEEEEEGRYEIDSVLSYAPNVVATLALIKRRPTLDSTRSLHAQIHVLNLFGPANDGSPSHLPGGASAEEDGAVGGKTNGVNGTPRRQLTEGKDGKEEDEDEARSQTPTGTPYESLHSLIHHGVSPYFDAYVSSRKDLTSSSATGAGGKGGGGGKERDAEAKLGIPMTKKKLAELELSLLHLQQNVEIPTIILAIHPIIRSTIERCHSSGERVSPLALPPEVVGDTAFLNKLQGGVNGWIKEIQQVTKLNRDVSSGTASQEINFWLSLETALEGIQDQLEGEEVLLTLEVLKHAKRFLATLSFIADTGLKEAKDTVGKYNQLMKDFPLNDLLSATDLERVHSAIIVLFSHITRKLRVAPYPIRRALPLVEAISRDLNDTLLKVLASQRLMYLPYPSFESSMLSVARVFSAWDEVLKEFTNQARELQRKRSEKFIPIKIVSRTGKLKERLAYLRGFRKQHEQLAVMTKGGAAGKGAGGVLGDVDMQEEVAAAYESVKNVDVLDVSQEGTEIWVTAENAYNERVSRVENQIIARLRDRLGSAKNANEMLRVLSSFNALFVRPKIRGAVSEYQTSLIESVKEDIRRLHDKFKTQYQFSEAYHMSQLRDLPPIAGAIIWAKQIERQLNTYMRRVEDVLGKGWEDYAEGQKLASESTSFRMKLDTKPIYEAWQHEIQKRNLSISGRIFDVARTRQAIGGLGNYQLVINFDSQVVSLFKETRNLLWLGFSVPHQISNIAKDAARVYSPAMSLMEAVRTYTQTIIKVHEHEEIAPLLASHRNDVQNMIVKGLGIRWESFVSTFDTSRHQLDLGGMEHRAVENSRHAQANFVKEFSKTVSLFQDRTDSLIEMEGDLKKVLEELEVCDYSREVFEKSLEVVQKTIDKLNLEGYSNLESWTKTLDEKIERVFIERLKSILELWSAQFLKDGSKEREGAHAAGRKAVEKKESKKDGALELKPIVHEVCIKNQVIYLDPPIEFARAQWYGQLQDWLGVICGLKRIQSSRYELGLKFKSRPEDENYVSVLGKFDEATLSKPFSMIEDKLSQISAYVKKWLQFQSLWDLESEYVYNLIGDSLVQWQQLLSEIRKTRSTFDNSETQKSFGVAVIDYEQVQSKVNAKYDTWQRDILGRFGTKLGSSMRETHAAILKARHDLEHQSVEGSSTAQAVSFITFVQDLKRKVKKWAPEIEIFASGQKTLERQRYQFATDWLYVDQIEGEWGAFNEILMRKNAAIQEQLAGLQMKIVAEDQIVAKRIGEIVGEWDQNKPIQGSLSAANAMNIINVFEDRVTRLKEEYDMVTRAKEALSLELVHDERLQPVLEEISDLKAVWTALSGVWAQIGELRETSWASIQPRKLRQQIDGLLASTKEMPARMRQYAAYEFVQDSLKAYLKSNILISELKSEALRERHWRQLYKNLKVASQYIPSQMTLGSVWDLDLKKNEGAIKEVIMQAQGEMALEEYLKQVKEIWTNYSLELVNYQTKTKLIKGWDDLFAKCSENLNSLTAMKMSPYYKVFEEEASSWEEKLNRIHVLFDVWIDVQRQWVYLEGIFSGSADIKHLLPVESQRFNTINAEFMSVMKKVVKSPFVLEVLQIAGVQKSLERLADLLSKIQKALGEYLERERSLFPRFYFVGDEDLLEIIGNSKDVVRVMKHLKKMFAGISSLILDNVEDVTQIEGISSREGEEVHFTAPIVLKDFPKINDWLTKLELEMKVALADLLQQSRGELTPIYTATDRLDPESFLEWVGKYPAQLVVLAIQVEWTSLTEQALEEQSGLKKPIDIVLRSLDVLADAVLTDLEPIKRKKCEHLITELVHQRDVLRDIEKADLSMGKNSFAWLYHMRFYHDPTISNSLDRLTVRMANAVFPYGYEYLGVPEKLVQTPLTDRCYLTMTQALDQRLGGSPFGPAGTGKTESIKALGVQLGRFVIVFCCDDTFDYQAMGRILVGLCKTGHWSCFDEVNRLSEGTLSAVSQQIADITSAQRARTNPTSSAIVQLAGKEVDVKSETAIFVTYNPGYAGRSNLPDNLKKLFRSMAMTHPDRELIAQVMLFSQGFRTAERLASKVVPFFNLCSEQLSSQPHYDFGLRALKAVLTSAGQLKRERIANPTDASLATSNDIVEQEIVIQSVTDTIVPKLVADDVPLLTSLLSDVFPGIDYRPVDLEKLIQHISDVCNQQHLQMGEIWLHKVLQLYQIQNIQHGLMMVGPASTGKSKSWSVLLQAMERLTGVEGVSYVIDPKAISKDALYGTLDPTTREWTDGLFTSILRKIIDNVRGESSKRHWIIFDGDVDPEWVENLNSVLDDNKLLTLPNGERLSLPPNVRIMFEVETLKYATLATVSRCGMVWFSDDAVTPSMMYRHYFSNLRKVAIDAADDELTAEGLGRVAEGEDNHLATQSSIATILEQHFQEDQLVPRALQYAATVDHIMEFTASRALTTLFSLLNKTVRNVLEYNTTHPDFPLQLEQIESYVQKRLLVSIVWSFTGDSKLDTRMGMGSFLRENCGLDFPPLGPGASLIDYDVQVSNSDWISWQNSVPTIEIETHSVTAPDVVIPTLDTVRHEDVLYAWLSEHKPLMLCGPPGSGKTMTLFSALRKLPDMQVIGLNFSSATTPELVLKTFEQHCEYRKTPNGVILSPSQVGRWIVIFCDEINLPATDKYGTQRVISFIRQLVEQNGYWRTSDRAWVKLERIQFVGACNPPTDPGRVPLTQRFLRHAPLVMVDYPGEASLIQIYGTFARALLKVIPTLRGYAEPLTAAMVEFYLASQRKFTADIQAHYVYSPRELSRWVRGVFESIRPLETLSVEGLVRVWAHEGLRLFHDRLVDEEERVWTVDMIDATALKHFSTIERDEALARPILFSNWTSKFYVSVDREELREFVKARLKVFYEEELDVQLVLFNDVLDHVLRIDRAFRQVQGHMLLIGVSGSGKTTLSRFVAWMNGLSVFQIKVHNKYTGDDFDEDLRTVLRRAGCKGEKICFIMDESNVLDSGFLERMNTLLANAEVPGLFEGDEYAALMTSCREGAQKDGLMLDTPDELYRWFTTQVAKNLHVVFTMNPPESGLASRAATSPALFNRCVLDWFGDWSDQAFYQVGAEFTQTLDLDIAGYAPPINFPIAYRQLELPPVHRTAVVNGLVAVHQSMYETNTRLSRRQGRFNYATPRHYLDFIKHYVRLFNEKRDDLEEQQRHLNVGLDKLKSTVLQVEELRGSLAVKRNQLEAKNAEADQKLQRMLIDQQEAEQNKKASEEIQVALKQQQKEIAERRAVVLADLANAEPAVVEAQQAVRDIRRQHIQEVRAMANPPEAVKNAMESVCIILGNKIEGWKSVQSILRRDDFTATIVSFDTSAKMTKSLRDKIKHDYLSNPNFNFETVNRASRACGPLVKWVIAQVGYSEILDRVGPLRQEVQSLEDQANGTKQKASHIITMIKDLEASIARYKDEYAALVRETEAIKQEMERVQTKVDRSITLLDSLGSEKSRWEGGSRTFEAQMATIPGDALLSAAFLAYAGFFDQQYRENMWASWANHLTDAGIKFKAELSLPEYLSTADDRLGWQAKSLPVDDLCTENAIMLKRFDRYPLIIDPSGQATTFVMNEYKQRKIAVTSFLDDAFLKTLESALRFGTPLLIQDVEHLDPILNAVLNKEIRRAGGRVLIRLGSQDIDFSPSFMMFLSTRDPSVNFSPDICSRVTFVNFTMTRGSLQSQCLNEVLKVERPDTDKKRTDLMKLQGEFHLRLRHLEKLLLQALNESSGNILDDDKVIDTLETLKKEAAEVSRKVEETDLVMAEVEQVTSVYLPLAQACSSIFFVLDQLALLHHFYQFSLGFFLDIFSFVLHRNPGLKGVTDPNQRLSILKRDIYLQTFKRTARALLHTDHLVLGMLLAQVKLRSEHGSFNETEFGYLLDSIRAAASSDKPAPGALNTDQAEKVNSLAELLPFKELRQQLGADPEKWKTFFDSETPETVVPITWEDLDVVGVSLREALLMKYLRPDRLLQAADRFVQTAFGQDISAEAAFDLEEVVTQEVKATQPISLASVPGYDASYKVDNITVSVGARCASIAMGTAEATSQADQAIAAAARMGSWVLLKNVHLAVSWLGQLEKRLQSMQANPNFRLFLTMETNPSIPVNILRRSCVVMNEPPPGIRANMVDSLQSIPSGRLSSGPAEKARLYFLLAWLHAVLQERMRYVPLGWSKAYEFNNSDQESTLNTIDKWVDTAARGKSNLAPEAIPFPAIRSLIKEAVYGGRIDRAVDQALLDAFVDHLFQPGAFENNFKLVRDTDLAAPEGRTLADFLSFARNLPEREPPSWLSLPVTAPAVISTGQGRDMLQKVLRMRSLDDDDGAAGSTTKTASTQPAWMRQVESDCKKWLDILPKGVPTMTFSDIHDPLARFFVRELQTAKKILGRIRKDLDDLILVCEGELKQTNDLRELLSNVNKGIVPNHFRPFKIQSLPLSDFINDFVSRLQQLVMLSETGIEADICLGKLFFPQSYITATRQKIARQTKVSLETLKLELDLESSQPSVGFRVAGLSLEGAVWNGSNLEMNNGDMIPLKPSQLRWVEGKRGESDERAQAVPVYLDPTRSELLFVARLPVTKGAESLMIERGVAIFV
ncbi:hypothetical protein BT69DRAFT_1319504 [Atractiella rhizophila]|nr:hypothetical protein BT69DRAFT_1319504 [Atractiella rhizophila]